LVTGGHLDNFYHFTIFNNLDLLTNHILIFELLESSIQKKNVLYIRQKTSKRALLKKIQWIKIRWILEIHWFTKIEKTKNPLENRKKNPVDFSNNKKSTGN